MLVDNILDKNEQRELLQILAEFTGESTIVQSHNLASTLPLCTPPPKIEFPTMTFCLTGRFAYGPRRLCVEAIQELGGRVSERINKTVDYLVVGTFCSTDWLHTSYGLKIKDAANLRNEGHPIAIVSEDYWAQAAFK